MLHKSTIKSEVKKQFSNIKVVDIKRFKFGMFCVKVEKQMSRSVKKGNLFGQTNFDKSESGVELDKKIDWI